MLLEINIYEVIDYDASTQGRCFRCTTVHPLIFYLILDCHSLGVPSVRVMRMCCSCCMNSVVAQVPPQK